jgi:hypothetical protein
MFHPVVRFHAAQPFNPVLAEKVLTVTYEVCNVLGSSYRYLSAAVPSASFVHTGRGCTRVTIPTRDEAQLIDHLNNFFSLSYRKLDESTKS